MNSYNVIGLMSGSSLDGIDLVNVSFQYNNSWSYKILAADNIPYNSIWKQKLSEAYYLDTASLAILDKEYGELLGKKTHDFIVRNNCTPEIIASHGHTIFHRPELHYTLQIGDGQSIANQTRCTVINDFRSEDVSKGGQGAPLVPIGDLLLFGEYPICLNIGGIANISYNINNERIAYDICIANQMLNYFAEKQGYKYDCDGNLARSGKINTKLFNTLNSNSFYQKKYPKSLGREFFENELKAKLENCNLSNNDILATITEHIAFQIAKSVENIPPTKLLVTGGGSHNKYLIDRLKQLSKHNICVPEKNTVDYKEALIFALLGVLRIRGEINVIASVTGASSDSSSGKIWTPKK